MNNNFNLIDLPKDLKYLLSAFLILMGLGIFIGLIYVYTTTNMTSSGITEQFNGSELLNDTDIPEKFPKPIENMLLTTHNHILTFSIISLLLGLIFYFNSIVKGFKKSIIIVEPFISIFVMFLSLWIMKYMLPSFVYLMIISSFLTYLCWYLMIFISIYELLLKKN